MLSVFVFLRFWTSPVPLLAQGETTSAIVGTVSDRTGAAIAGATVTITGTDNGIKRSVRTDDAGRFNFPQLKPGSYSVKAEADRFEARQNNGVAAGLGQKQTVDLTLDIAGVTQRYTEMASAKRADFPRSSNGRTAAFGAVNRGSNPCRGANM